MKFIIKEEVGVSACATDDSEMDEEDEDDQWEYYDDSTTLSDFWQVTTPC